MLVKKYGGKMTIDDRIVYNIRLWDTAPIKTEEPFYIAENRYNSTIRVNPIDYIGDIHNPVGGRYAYLKIRR